MGNLQQGAMNPQMLSQLQSTANSSAAGNNINSSTTGNFVGGDCMPQVQQSRQQFSASGISNSSNRSFSQYRGTTMYRRLERERIQLEGDAFEGLVFIVPSEYRTADGISATAPAAAAAGPKTLSEGSSSNSSNNGLSEISTQSSSINGRASAADPAASSQQTSAASSNADDPTSMAPVHAEDVAATTASFSAELGCSEEDSLSSNSSSHNNKTNSLELLSSETASSTRERIMRELPESLRAYSVVGDAAHDGFTWLLAIEGASGTLYEGELFVLKFNFSPKYPIEAPEVTFVLPYLPVHPHVYSNGHICLSILYDHWSPALSVSSCGMSLLSMLSSCKAKTRPPDDDIYCRLWSARSPKHVKWIFHDDHV